MTAGPDITINIRKAKHKDISGVMDIETQQFPHPWKEKYFVHELDHDIAYFYVAENKDDGHIAGYIIFWIIEETMELHNIAVSRLYMRKGIGKQLFDFMVHTAQNKNVKECFLEVRASNQEARSFYEKLGFKKIAERKDYYNQPVENAVIYEMRVKRM